MKWFLANTCLGLAILLISKIDLSSANYWKDYWPPYYPNKCKVCQMPADVGDCDSECPRYYFNSKEQQCELFTYGCCGGNKNKFQTYWSCKLFCKSRCYEPMKEGPCKARFRRWYFNKKTCKCEQFFWGGCRPNGNNFESLKDCLKTCP